MPFPFDDLTTNKVRPAIYAVLEDNTFAKFFNSNFGYYILYAAIRKAQHTAAILAVFGQILNLAKVLFRGKPYKMLLAFRVFS